MNNSDFAKKLKKKLIIRALIFCGVLLSINTYAWFIFITKVDTNIDVTVAAWDIKFFENDDIVQDLNVVLDFIYPDMDTYEKQITIVNRSEVPTKFSCKIEKVSILGHEYIYDETQEATASAYSKLQNDYPFYVTMNPFYKELEINESMDYTLSVEWPFENSSSYYRVNELFTYDESIAYYTLNGSTYSEIAIDEENFESNVNSGLYVESDDADSYYGNLCGIYQEETGESCLTLKLKLVVEQLAQ